jgi:hypothetical protein
VPSRLISTLLAAALCGACVFDASGLDPTDPSDALPPPELQIQDAGADGANGDGALEAAPDAALDQSTDAPSPDHRVDGPPPPDGPVSDTVPTGWWDTTWKRRRRVSFDNSKQKSALVDFPALIVVKTGRIDYAATANNGADLRFVDPDGKLLAYEIERWNAKGSSFIWVKVPQIDGASAVDYIWLYYGNGTAKDGQQAATVWSNGYQAVWHLHNNLNDSSAQGQNATNVKSTNGVGKIADGQRLNGTDQYIDTNYTKNPSSWTTSAWVRGEAAPAAKKGPKNAISGPLMKEESFQLTWDHHDPYFRAGASLKTTNTGWRATPFGTLTAKTWHLLAATYDGAALRAYQDGKYIGQVAATGSPVTRSDSAKIGRHCYRTDVHPYLNGTVDEVRIAHVVRSTDWLAAQHLSMSDTFATFGPEQKLP